MMMREGASPSTKADLAALGETLKSEMADLGKELRSEMATKTDLTALGKALRAEMATKADLTALGEALRAEMATKADLTALGEALRAEMATKTEVSDLRKEMRSGHLRLAVQIERQQNEIRLVEERLRGDIVAIKSEVRDQLEAFTGRMETIWRESARLPHVIDEQARTIGDHEARIVRLERRAA